MLGRRVRVPYAGAAEVVRWEPLGSGLCDTLVRLADGTELWVGSGDLRPLDGRGPLPARAEVQRLADVEALAQLRAIRGQLVRKDPQGRYRLAGDFARPWPGAEHGKGLVGQALDGAIAEVAARVEGVA